MTEPSIKGVIVNGRWHEISDARMYSLYIDPREIVRAVLVAWEREDQPEVGDEIMSGKRDHAPAFGMGVIKVCALLDEHFTKAQAKD